MNNPSRKLIQKRYESLFDIGTDLIIESGYTEADGVTPRSWYSHAADQMIEANRLLCPDLPLDFFAGVAAICSPVCTILENISKTINYCNTGKEPLWQGVLDNYELQFSRTGNATIIGSNGKPTKKTECFRQGLLALTSYGSTPEPCIDRHMIDAGWDTLGVITANGKFVDSCKFACDAVAKAAGVPSYVAQERIWCGQRAHARKKDIFSWFCIADIVKESLAVA